MIILLKKNLDESLDFRTNWRIAFLSVFLSHCIIIIISIMELSEELSSAWVEAEACFHLLFREIAWFVNESDPFSFFAVSFSVCILIRGEILNFFQLVVFFALFFFLFSILTRSSFAAIRCTFAASCLGFQARLQLCTRCCSRCFRAWTAPRWSIPVDFQLLLVQFAGKEDGEKHLSG